MRAEAPNFWFAAAAWWAIMVVVGLIFTLPILGWTPVVQAGKVLIAPIAALLAIGLFLNNPQRYLAWLTLIYALFVIPTIIVCLAPLASVAIALGPKLTLGYLALLIVALAALSLWFIVMRLIREKRCGIGQADSYIFFEEGAAFVKLSDLQGPHTSKGDVKVQFLASPIAGLAMIGYPLQKFLVLTSGSASVTFLIAILLTPVGCWLVAWMVCKFASWALPVWRYERLHGNKIYLKRTE